ncbi:MAG: coiled-coil domain-containing protein [Candidatus Binatia bacterium]
MNRRVSYWVIFFMGLAFVGGLIFGLLLRPPAESRPPSEIENFKRENLKLTAEKGALTEAIGLLETKIKKRDQEIGDLRSKMQDLNRSREELETLKDEVERLKREVARQQAKRVDTEKQLSRAREWTAFLERSFQIYRVIRETPLLRNPYENAEVILRLSPGRKVRIVDIVDGKWLKVHYSRLGVPPGYIRRGDAVRVRP